MKRVKNELQAYEVVNDWRPFRARSAGSAMKRVYAAVERLQKGQSFFIPIDDCKLATISYYLFRDKDVYRTRSFYVSAHGVRNASGKVIGTQIYRAI